MNPKRHARSVVAYSLASLGLLASSYGGSYVNDFTSSTLDRMTLNGGTRASNNQPYPAIENGYLAIVYAENSETGTAVLDDLDTGSAIESFNMSYKVRIGGGSSTPADGMSVFLGNIDSTANFGEEGPADGANGINGLTVAFDIYDNGGGEAPAIDVKVNGVTVGHKAYDINGITTDTFAPVTISLKKNGLLTVTYKGQPVFTDLYLPGYAPAAGDRFAIGARTGGLNANQWIDDLNITTVLATATAPTITTPPASLTVNERAPATFTVAVDGSAPFTYQWLSNNVAIDGATSATYTITNAPVSANGAKYKVTVTNATAPVTSSEATLNVTPDTTAPTVASVAGNETLNGVVVTFSEPIDPTSLAAASNYSLSGGLTISSVDVINDHTVRLNTSAQTAGTSYTLTVTGLKDTAATPNSIAANTTVNFKSFVLSLGFLKFEYWGNINSPGTPAVSELTSDPRYPNSPDLVGFVTAFNSRTIFPDDSHEQYGARLSGFIIPQVTGDYRFFLYSDDASELDLSNDSSTAGLTMIAQETGCCNPFSEPSDTNPRTSAPIHLEANTPYAVQALLKEGGGGDYIQVAWRLEGDTTPAASLQPIPGSFLATYADPGAATITFTTQPVATTAAENTKATFTAAATGSPSPITYQWQRKAAGAADFTDIAGATSATYTTPILKQSTDNGATYRVIARVPGATSTSSEVALNVIIDSTPPQLVRAIPGDNQKSVTLTFSEAVDPTTAAQASNYTINGLTVSSATVNGDTVVLTTSQQTAASTYTVTVSGVKDSALNVVDPAHNTQQFTAPTILAGVLKDELFYYIGGTAVSDLLNNAKYPNNPDVTKLLVSFNSQSSTGNEGDNYGAKMSGFVIPDTTGDYRFFISSDDGSSLWISTDDSAAHLSASPIATEPGCCNAFMEPDPANPQTSDIVHLEAGKKYYIQYIYKEGGGGDYGKVAWRLEGDATAAADLQPISGKNLAAALSPSLLDSITLKNGTAPGTGTGGPGFKARIYQVDQQHDVSPVNEVSRAEQQLAGLLGPNVADQTAATGGIWTINDFINWNQEMNTGGNGAEIGSFQSTSDPSRPDQPIPGIPGTGTAAHNLDAIAAEAIGYVEFPAAGLYYLGVNSDDGFAVTGTDKPPVNNGALVVTSPASIAGSYHTAMPTYQDTGFPVIKTPITGKLVYATPNDGCAPLTNPDQIRGNIALIDRGVCTFDTKAADAKAAGAIAVIIVNSRDPSSSDGPFPIITGGGTDIPTVMISKPDGATIKTAIGQDITISITPDTTPLLGSFNAGRGSEDTVFPVIVPTAGVYPLRTVWYEGGGGANLEVFSVTTDTGEKILLNDTANAKALKSFVSRSGSTTTPTISISQSQTGIVINFTGHLYAADKVDGPYALVPGTGSVTVSPTGTMKFYQAGP